MILYIQYIHLLEHKPDLDWTLLVSERKWHEEAEVEEDEEETKYKRLVKRKYYTRKKHPPATIHQPHSRLCNLS